MILKRHGTKQKPAQKPAQKQAQKPVAQKPKSCHSGLTEILPRVYVGRLRDIEDLAAKYQLDRVYALAGIDAVIWSSGWRGVIEAVPIADMGVLPRDLLDRTVQDILARARAGERVALGCVGGHGRTGYVAAALLGVADPSRDPIATVRTQYCPHAVESEAQITHLAEYLARDDLRQHAPAKTWPLGAMGGGWWWEDADDWWFNAPAAAQPPQNGRKPYAQSSVFLRPDAVTAISRVEGVPRERVELLSQVAAPPVTDSEEPILLYGLYLWWVDPVAGVAVTEQRQADGALAYVGYRYRLRDVQDAAAPTTAGK